MSISFFLITQGFSSVITDKNHAAPSTSPWTPKAAPTSPDVVGERTRRHDLRVFHQRNLQAPRLPSVLWMLLPNGTFLGIYVYQASTFATIPTSPPYGLAFDWLGRVQLVQVLDCVVLVPTYPRVRE